MLSIKSLVSSLLLTTIVSAGENGGGGGGGGGDFTRWLTTTCWETKSAEKEYITVWQTQTQTQWAKPESITVWQTKWETPGSVTVYNTLTELETKLSTIVSLETDIITTTATIYSTVNHYFTNTATQTQVQVSYETATATIYSTVNNYFTDTATQTQTQIQTQISRETATATATVVSASVSVTTEFSTITDTVTEFPVCTTAPLIGLVTCPTRTLNPTYTPPTALPTNWLWGCPPDTLCTPKQIDCNFESNLPADTYVCSPEDCKPVTPLPPLDTSWDAHNCTPYIPPPGYANLAPPIFDLGYDIFQFNGQPGPYCPPPPPPPPSTTWQDWAPPPSPPPSSTWVDWVPQPPPPPPSSWADWSVSGPAGPAPSGWNDWNGNGDHSHGQSGKPSPPGVTPRANLAERQDDAPDYDVPPACYNPCNAAVLNAQSCGLKGAVLCPVSGVFSQQYTNCGNCIDVNKDKAYTEPPKLISSLVTFLDYCSGYVSEAAAQTQASSTTTSSVSAGSTSTLSSTSGESSSSMSTATSSTPVVAALSTTSPLSSSVPNGAESQGPSSKLFSLTIFTALLTLLYI